MSYLLRDGLADALAIAHGLLLLVASAGAIVVALGRFAGRWPLPAWQRFYLAAAAGTALSGLLHGDCVLTTWEKALRERGRPGSAYDGSFVGHYAPFVPGEIADGGSAVLAAAALVGACQASRTGLMRLGLRRRPAGPRGQP